MGHIAEFPNGVTAVSPSAGGFQTYKLSLAYSAEAAGAADAIDITGQVTDQDGRPIATQVALEVYYSADGPAAGSIVGATSGSALAALAPGVLIMTVVAARFLMLGTDANGAFAVRLTVAGGASTRYVFFKMPAGNIITTDLLTFA